ncbi:MAG: cellulase family glycosylhydrolase [Candidatus Lernaella stagnicola]|nr:cellulase family glycosylhydrolase [Candidatus Lernaella stagnicola]
MRQKSLIVFGFLVLVMLISGCADDGFDLDDQAAASITRIHTDKTYLRDAEGRYLLVHGTNVSCASKYPAKLDPISYVGKPFPLEEADKNFQQLRDMGFNTIRLLTIWEAIEPFASGEYDEEYLDYFEQIVAKANEYGIYCLIDMHQDLFSRWMRKFYVDANPPGVNALEAIPGLDDFASPQYNNVIQGDGAPRWAVALTLPEKDVGGSQWGLPMWDADDRTRTTDVPALHWGVANFLSVDIARAFATFFAGREIYPDYMVEGKNVQDYLQDSYANAWVALVERIGKYPNVLGYDIMNEPLGLYIAFMINALLYQEAKMTANGELTEAQVEFQVDVVLEKLHNLNMPPKDLRYLRRLLLTKQNLPRTPEEFAAAGFPLDPAASNAYAPNVDGVLALSLNFNRNFLQPFHSKVGQAIQEIDPDAVLYVEGSLGADDTAGIFGFYATPMRHPEGLEQIVFAPHVYADVYPFVLSYNPEPREFTTDEIMFRDYTDLILGAIGLAAFGMGNPPVLLGEFGTYFNLNGIEDAVATDFIVPAAVLDNYYEVHEENLINRTVWCYSPDNWLAWGEGWNQEDFSILGADETPRADDAYTRVTPRFTSGRLISYKYNSPLAYYEPREGVPTPIKEFNMEMAGLESAAPTEITVPRRKYPDGFYVYVSDGKCYYDATRNILYWFPSNDDPEATHTIRIRPPWEDYGDRDWNYFFKDDQVVEGRS